jgi:3-dehydrosphinganine reductase
MGRGVAKILAQKGANVVIVARNRERLAEALSYVKVSLTFTQLLYLKPY